MLNQKPVSKPTFFNLTILAAALTYTLSVSGCSTAQTIAAKSMPTKTTPTVANTPINAHPTANAVTDATQQTPSPTDFDSDRAATRHEYTLDNGLKVIIKEDHRSPVVISQVWYRVGAADEPTHLGGMSHLLEHMMFKGTKNVSSADFERLIAKFGGSNNAFTSYDYTAYYEIFPANRLALGGKVAVF